MVAEMGVSVMTVLDGGGPLYAQVYSTVRAAIVDGRTAPGHRLPSERELAARLHVSRATVRRALTDLVGAGLIEANDGQGFRVAGEHAGTADPIGEETEVLMSFSELAASRGLVPSADVLQCSVETADFEDSDRLSVAPGTEVLVLQRLRRLDGVPVALDHSRIPMSLVPDAQGIDWSTASLYVVLESNGHAPLRADYTAVAIGADERESTLLGVDVGAPLLATTTLSREQGGRPGESCRLVCRGDRYRFRATLRRRAHRSAPQISGTI
ncbi:GntR family transcriptional regulator [soil metagenome]